MRLATTRGVRKEFRVLETEVWKWALAESERIGKRPTKVSIQKYAREKYRAAGHNDFKASVGWYRRWGKRYQLTKVAENSPKRTVATAESAETPPSSEEIILNSSPLTQQHKDGSSVRLNETLESFSIETDKLMNDIDMIDSPSEFFDFIESAVDVEDTDDVSMKNLIKELMDDFGRYCNESNSSDEKNSAVKKLCKKSCKYDKDFKDKVIRYINQHRTCFMETAAKFKINPETVSIWVKENKFQDQLTQIFIEESNKMNIDCEIGNKENEFYEWLDEKEKTNRIVSKDEVKEKLTSLFAVTWNGKSHWFAKYCFKYLQKKQSNKAIKINYSSQFQKLMVNYASKTSQKRTASVFNLARKQIFNWVKHIRAKDDDGKKEIEEKLYEWYNAKTLKPAGRTIREKANQLFSTNSAPKNSYDWYYKWCAKSNIAVKRSCDEEIVEWILGAYDRNLSVSHEDVQRKALESYNSRYEGTFKASTGWLLRFCRRYMNLLRRIPPLNATLPIGCESNIKGVREKVKMILCSNKINAGCYGVMDEILLKLKPGSHNDMEQKPLLRSCGTNNIQGTVILTCLSDGTILPPVLALKDKHGMKDNLDRFSIIHQPNGIVDENVMQFWLVNVWFKYVRAPNLLLMDCFEPHTSEEVKKTFEEHESHLIVIPAGCSSKLNPLTQIVAPEFQEIIDQHCRKWFEEDSLSWQMDGSSVSLSSQDMIEWVGKAYNSVNNSATQENVRNVFRRMELTL